MLKFIADISFKLLITEKQNEKTRRKGMEVLDSLCW